MLDTKELGGNPELKALDHGHIARTSAQLHFIQRNN
jgi:hypothetical protein